MKKLTLLTISLILSSAGAFAAEVPSLSKAKAQRLASSIGSVTVLGQNTETDKTYRLVTIDKGLSTDLSPRHEVLVTYFHGGEMNNTQTAFSLGGFFGVVGVKRLEAGIYEIKVKDQADQGGFKTTTLIVNTHQVAIDEKNLKPEDFEDPYFSSTISVSAK